VPQKVNRAGHAVPYPGSANAAGDIEGLRFGLECLRVALLDDDPVSHTELLGATAGGGDKHLTDVDTHTAGAEVLRPAAEHLALSAGQVEHAGALLDASPFTDLHQLGVGEGVKDSMVDLGDFVKRKRHVTNRPTEH